MGLQQVPIHCSGKPPAATLHSPAERLIMSGFPPNPSYPDPTHPDPTREPGPTPEPVPLPEPGPPPVPEPTPGPPTPGEPPGTLT
ncbi:hypothetical protein CQ020_20025 [Arthrobacter sp. MYb23]|nr:hypothetical protein CQ038_19230 [Arthrobacter sp. MYb51]PRB92958.1 hypothetical protein CQ020_20025 [Arthrobacter sp. MYb23]